MTTDPNYRRLLRRVLQAERRAHHPRPSRLETTRPDRADEVLRALAGAFEPGQPLTVKEIAEAAEVAPDVAAAVRRWARDAGQWPYRQPPTGLAALAAAEKRRKAEGGAS